MKIYLIRAEILTKFSELATELGLNAAHLLEAEGLSETLLSDPETRIPYTAVVQLLRKTSLASHRDDFGLQLSKRQRAFPIGLPRLLMQHAPTVRSALELLTQHNHLHSQSIVWQLETDQQYAYLQRHDKMAGKYSGFHYATLSIAHAVMAIRTLIQQSTWRPTRVQFTYAEPAQAQLFTDFFQAPVFFDQEVTAIIFPIKLLDKPCGENDPVLQKLVTEKLKSINKHSELGLQQQLENLIRANLHKKDCQLAPLARRLNLHPKKIQRELAQQGLSFRRLKAEIRLDMAEHYLNDSSLPLTTLSDILGFSDLSGLSRAFKLRHGISPQEWRTQQTQTQ